MASFNDDIFFHDELQDFSRLIFEKLKIIVED